MIFELMLPCHSYTVMYCCSLYNSDQQSFFSTWRYEFPLWLRPFLKICAQARNASRCQGISYFLCWFPFSAKILSVWLAHLNSLRYSRHVIGYIIRFSIDFFLLSPPMPDSTDSRMLLTSEAHNLNSNRLMTWHTIYLIIGVSC